MMIRIQGIRNLTGKIKEITYNYRNSARAWSSEMKPKNESANSTLRQQDVIPSTFDKYILVWMKKYPSVKDVPPVVMQHTLERARNVARIRINVIMVGITIIACIGMIFAGRKAAKEGQSIAKMNLDWHKQIEKKD